MTKRKSERHGEEKKIIPGSFRDPDGEDYNRMSAEILRNARKGSNLPEIGANVETPKPKVYRDLVEQYEFFRARVYNPKRVFYPCCDVDISPIRGFPDSEVVLMDREECLKEVMEKEGIVQFVHGDVLKYKPESQFDLVIILNPSVLSRDLTKHLSSRGYALANNWHDSASQLLENPDFEGVGTIDRNEKGIYFLRNDFSRLEPNQFATYLYVFRKLECRKNRKSKGL